MDTSEALITDDEARGEEAICYGTPYEPPTIRSLGSLSALTLGNGNAGSDGLFTGSYLHP